MSQRFIERHPEFGITSWDEMTRGSPDAEKIPFMVDALRKAGLPD